MTLPTTLRVDLPSWVRDFHAQLPKRLVEPEQRMQVAISLSRQNVIHRSGGPFGALVVTRRHGEVIALGVNRVEPAHCTAAHAEIMALSLAQQALAGWDLSATDHGALELVSSCEPCAMCLGAIPWSRVSSLVCGATREDAEAAGFNEGDRAPQWVDRLNARGIQVTTQLLRAEAAEVMNLYARSGGVIY